MKTPLSTLWRKCTSWYIIAFINVVLGGKEYLKKTKRVTSAHWLQTKHNVLITVESLWGVQGDKHLRASNNSNTIPWKVTEWYNNTSNIWRPVSKIKKQKNIEHIEFDDVKAVSLAKVIQVIFSSWGFNGLNVPVYQGGRWVCCLCEKHGHRAAMKCRHLPDLQKSQWPYFMSSYLKVCFDGNTRWFAF